MPAISLEISNDQSGQRIDRFLASAFEEFSRSAIQEMINKGNIVVLRDQKSAGKIKNSFILKENDKIEINLEPREKLEVLPDDSVKFEIIYDDPDYIIINKPAGLVVHPGNGHPDKTLVNGLLARFPEIEKLKELNRMRPGIVHRLDKNTSGIMIAAKNKRALLHFKSEFESRNVKKTYIALLHGNLKKKSDIIEGYMSRNKKNPIQRTLFLSHVDGSKFSSTKYKVIKRFKNYTLVEVFPETGRMHQIRVHFASIGHPIVGDILYGADDSGLEILIDESKEKDKHRRFFLHAKTLKFEGLDGKEKKFSAELPRELESFLNTLQ